MALLRLAFFPGGTGVQWENVVEAIGDVSPPVGRRAFAAGAVEGGWQVMQLWDSRQELERFNREIFLPAMAELGDRGFLHPPVVQDIDTVVAWIGEERV